MLAVPAIAVDMPILPDEEITDSGMLRAMMNGIHKVLWYLGYGFDRVWKASRRILERLLSGGSGVR